MSVQVMTLVWRHFPRGGSDKLVMLALADWCNDQGGSLHPSIAGLAQKVNTSESQARRILHMLIEEGWLSVVGNEFGGAPGSTRQYKLHVEKLGGTASTEGTRKQSSTGRTNATRKQTLTGSVSARGGVDARGSADAQDGSHPCAETGSADAHRRLAPREPNPSLEPSLEPPKNHQGCDDAFGLDASELGSPVRNQAKAQPEPKGAQTWAAYAGAYRIRYGIEPVRNARVNGQIGQIVDRLGRDEAPHVAAFFVQHNASFYVSKGHAVGLLLADAEKLRTEWATGRKVTSIQARQIEKTQANLDSHEEALAILESRGIR